MGLMLTGGAVALPVSLLRWGSTARLYFKLPLVLAVSTVSFMGVLGVLDDMGESVADQTNRSLWEVELEVVLVMVDTL